MKQRLIIIGNGMAGSRLTAELLARNGAEKYDITLFGDEPGGAYNRILLSDVLNGSKTAESVVTHSLEWYASRGATLRAGEKIVAIDRERWFVDSDQGARVPFDTLVLATGSSPLIPPMDGLKTPSGERKRGVFVMRTLADCDRIAGYAQKVNRAVVVGGGLLGLEAARGLAEHGAQVHLVHRSKCLMSAQLDQSASDLLQREIEMMGLNVHLDKVTTALLGEESVTGLQFSDGTELCCDMVVLACGVVPNVELARSSGLQTRKAVLVDDQLRAPSEANIFAVGECAEHRGVTYGLVGPVWEQARVVAEVLSNSKPDAKYEGSNVSTKLKVMGVELASIGAPHERAGDEVITYAEPKRGRYKKLIIRDGRLAGAILLGDARKAAFLTQAFDRAMPLPEERAQFMWDIGKGATSDVSALPDDATVCNCNGVSAGTLRACVANGAQDLAGVMNQTRAGTGCGTCKSSVREFLKAASSTKDT